MFFFFCKQKTAYELRISDWSSDVCSSDLSRKPARKAGRSAARARSGEDDIIWDLLAMPRKAAGILAMRRRKVARIWPRRGGDSAPRARGRAMIRRHRRRARSEEHTSELQSLMRTSYAVFCLKKKKK